MTKLTTVKRKANVGERILITGAESPFGTYKNGAIFNVKAIEDGCVYAEETAPLIWHREYEVIEVKPSAIARLTEAEAKIAALEAEVAALKKAEITVTLDGKAVGCIVSESIVKAPKPNYGGWSMEKAGVLMWQAAINRNKTPNQRRADVIKRAQAFGADLERGAPDEDDCHRGNRMLRVYRTKLEFHVYADKRTVVALARGYGSNEIRSKACAKCHEDDVFNADIGKAIAAGKLYGVDIPKNTEAQREIGFKDVA